ncbi:MAG: hypothetical protein IAI48_00365 [Candidatus Eremiobacteraeota bacterium]|nr:hypothetical protein [Candidatus Eremiobacteraeota bacterium]
MNFLEPWQQQEAYLRSVLTAATATGAALAGYTIENVAPPASDLPQVLGWQYRRHSDRVAGLAAGGQGRKSQVAVFDFMLVVARAFNNMQTDTANQARIQAQAAWNDGSGHGLATVLLGDPTLGGNCTFSTVDVSITVGRSVTSETDTSAIVLATLTTTAQGVPIFYT